jgi:hypothetical protein
MIEAFEPSLVIDLFCYIAYCVMAICNVYCYIFYPRRLYLSTTA